MAEELDFGHVWIRRVAVVGNATCRLADELDVDALDLQPRLDMDYALDQVIVGVDGPPA